jgi:hypothetical protein
MKRFVALALVLATSCARTLHLQALPAAEAVLVLPVANLSGSPAALRELGREQVEALSARGIPVAGEREVEEFLARHRFRNTADLVAASAGAALAELHVASILVTSLTSYSEAFPPRFGVSLRLVSTGDAPRVLWMDQAGRTGDDSPGPFDLGVVRDVRVLRRQVLEGLALSLRGALDGTAARTHPCAGDHPPADVYRSPSLHVRKKTVAIVPFANQSERRSAGELVALLVAGQALAAGDLQVVEPGLVRRPLAEYRLPVEGGISLDTARVLLDLTSADYLVMGTVRELDDPPGGAPPRADFSMTWLGRDGEEVAWESTSWAQGDDSVHFFNRGYVSTAAELACSMAASAIARIVRDR